ncbi:MAG: hypothetical protein IJX30_02385 [Clostridia bacterium]|nr:hypothetical protein [Clostridia bacterium]
MEVLRIKNGNGAMEINLAQGVLVSLQGNGRDLCAGNTYPLFVVAMIAEDYEKSRISSLDCQFEGVEEKDEEYILTYTYLDKIVITAVVAYDTDSFRFRIQVKNNTKDLIEWVEYPGISFEDDLDGSKKSNILWMFNEGALVSYCKDKMWPYEEPEYPSWGTLGIFPNMVQSQFMAYLYGNGGLYVGCHDKNHGVKQIDFYHKDERIKLQLRFYSGAYYGQDFSMNFDVVFRFFNGEWQDACEIYRAWYESVTTVKKLEENLDLPVWYQESPLVVALPIRGAHDTAEMAPSRYYPYDNLLKEVERISAKTNSKLLVLLMQWEGTAPWAPPYVWPPYGGEDAFKEFADKLHTMGHYLGLYCSGFAWTQQSKLIKEYNKEKEFEERNLQAEMCVSPEQTLAYSRICTPQRVGYDFCPTSKVLKEIIQSEVANMFAAGVDYIQLLDQNHGGNSYFCYSKSHGHPHAPGAWQVDAMNGILEDIHQDKRLFGCESAAAEPFIKNLLFSDNRWTYAEMVGDAVPAYAYIYHSRVNNFMGNQSCCPFQYTEGDYRYRITYSFLAGDMLTVVLDNDGDVMHYWGAARKNVGKPDQESVFLLLNECNAWRNAAKEYLLYGDMVKPKQYDCDEFCEFTIVRRQAFPKKVPKVMANAFVYKGKRADVFVNHTTAPVTITIPKNAGERLYVSAFAFAQGEATMRQEEQITVAPLSVVVVESDK